MSNTISLHCLSTTLSHVGKTRQINEDRVLALPQIGIFAVADGMGGHYGGDYASQYVIDRLADTAASPQRLANGAEALEDAVQDANLHLWNRGQENNQIIGSTVAILLAHGNFCFVLWAGDSRIYRLRARTLRQLTTDHTQAELLVAEGLMTRADALRHPTGARLTRAVGAAATLYLEADLHALHKGDRYLLCSDGLNKHLTDREIEDLLSLGTPDDAAQTLVDLAMERGGKDNITVAVVDIRSIMPGPMDTGEQPHG
jgi:serine/threonine protein phosphatase PrpC